MEDTTGLGYHPEHVKHATDAWSVLRGGKVVEFDVLPREPHHVSPRTAGHGPREKFVHLIVEICLPQRVAHTEEDREHGSLGAAKRAWRPHGQGMIGSPRGWLGSH